MTDSMMTVDEALSLIPGRRDILNNMDDRLAHVIRHVEHTLAALKVSLPSEVFYKTDEGHFYLGYGKWNGKFQILWGTESDDDTTKDTTLLGASRQVRAEVFLVCQGHTQSPIEQLIVAAAQSLDDFAKERSPSLERAMHLASVLERAGFPGEVVP